MQSRLAPRSWLLPWLVLTGLPLGCQQQAPPADGGSAAVVVVSQPLERKVTDYRDFTGRTVAVEAVDVRARVSGYLQEIAFQPGQEVKKDQLLFRIDPTIYEAAVEKAKADIDLYQAQVKLAQSELERNRRLLAVRATSTEDFEKIAAQREQAVAGLAGARAQLAIAKQNLDWSRVLSPIDGKTGVNLITKGNLVVADQTLLTTIVSLDPMYAYFDVDEGTVLYIRDLIRQGKAKSYQDAAYPVWISLSNQTGFPFKGIIDYVSNQVNLGTGTLNVRGKFSNEEGILTPGLNVRVRIPVGQPHKALLVTDRALGSDQGQPYLLMVDEKNEVMRRNVRVGALHDGGLREITEGLKAEDWVIVEGLLRVRPGVAAQPKRQPMPEQPDRAASVNTAKNPR